jgi:hypothetical protein
MFFISPVEPVTVSHSVAGSSVKILQHRVGVTEEGYSVITNYKRSSTSNLNDTDFDYPCKYKTSYYTNVILREE